VRPHIGLSFFFPLHDSTPFCSRNLPGGIVDLLKLLESIKALDIFAPNQQLQRSDIVALRVYPFVSGGVAIKSTFVSDLSVSINVANSKHFHFLLSFVFFLLS
jgi:hypothetical protein